jgi:hypothetical protein
VRSPWIGVVDLDHACGWAAVTFGGGNMFRPWQVQPNLAVGAKIQHSQRSGTDECNRQRLTKCPHDTFPFQGGGPGGFPNRRIMYRSSFG